MNKNNKKHFENRIKVRKFENRIKVRKLVFYDQSTGTVISGQKNRIKSNNSLQLTFSFIQSDKMLYIKTRI